MRTWARVGFVAISCAVQVAVACTSSDPSALPGAGANAGADAEAGTLDAISEEASVEIDVGKACEDGLTLDEFRTICSDPTLNKKYYKSCGLLWALYLQLPVTSGQLQSCPGYYLTSCGCGRVVIECDGVYEGWSLYFDSTTGKLVGVSEGDGHTPGHLCEGYLMHAGDTSHCECSGVWDSGTCTDLDGGGCEAGVDAPADAADAPEASEPADAEPDVTDASSSP